MRRCLTRMAYGEPGIVGTGSTAPRQNRIDAGTNLVHVGAAVFMANPLAYAAMRGDFAIEAHGVFEGHKGALVLDAPHKRREMQGMLRLGLGWGDVDDVDAVGRKDALGAVAGHPWIAITKPIIDTANPGGDDGVGTGRCTPVECTWFEGDI